MAKAKFDIKTEATRAFYAGVGVTDLAVEARARVRRRRADQARRRPEGRAEVGHDRPRAQGAARAGRTVVNARVDALTKDAKARRAAIEARVAELQAEAQAYPAKVQTLRRRQRRDRRRRLRRPGQARREPRRPDPPPGVHEGDRDVRADHRRQGEDHQDPGDQGDQDDRQEGHRPPPRRSQARRPRAARRPPPPPPRRPPPTRPQAATDAAAKVGD